MKTPTPTKRPTTKAERLHRLLSQPQTVKELWLLRELLDKPLALRQR